MMEPLSNTKLRVPNGFPDILESFTREVLRSQPKDIFAFGVTFFERLLPPKDTTIQAPVPKESSSKDRFYNNDSFQKESLDPSNPQQQNAALAIQTKYRQHAATKEVQNMREEQAAIKIQAGVRGYIDRSKLRERVVKAEECPGEAEDKTAPKEPTSGEGEGQTEGVKEVDIDLNDPDVEKAAIKIQAGFKGFKTRQDLSTKQSESNNAAGKEGAEGVDINVNDPDVEKAAIKDLSSSKESESNNAASMEGVDEVDIDLNDPDVEKAAIKIQASFKGFKARKDLSSSQQSEEAVKDTETVTTDETQGKENPDVQPEIAGTDETQGKENPDVQPEIVASIPDKEADSAQKLSDEKEPESAELKQEDTSAAPETVAEVTPAS